MITLTVLLVLQPLLVSNTQQSVFNRVWTQIRSCFIPAEEDQSCSSETPADLCLNISEVMKALVFPSVSINGLQ